MQMNTFCIKSGMYVNDSSITFLRNNIFSTDFTKDTIKQNVFTVI